MAVADAAVVAAGLTKRYGRRIGCEAVDLVVPQGSVFGLLGPNGAGKSTLVRTLVGLLQPDAGEARILGRPVRDPASRRDVGYLPELFRYPDWLTAREVLVYHGRLAGLAPGDASRQAVELLERVGLADRADTRVGTFSKGMQQRLGLACALVGEPQVVFLDEPTSALDPLGRRDVRGLVRELRDRGVTVFLNSHLLSEVEEVCDFVAVMRGGRVVAAGRLDELVAPSPEVELYLEDPDGRAGEVIAGCARPVARRDPAGQAGAVPSGVPAGNGRVRLRVRLDPAVSRSELVARLVQAGVGVDAVVPVRNDLEDVFVALAGREGERQ